MWLYLKLETKKKNCVGQGWKGKNYKEISAVVLIVLVAIGNPSFKNTNFQNKAVL